jgi:hypothetical protein
MAQHDLCLSHVILCKSGKLPHLLPSLMYNISDDYDSSIKRALPVSKVGKGLFIHVLVLSTAARL